MTEREKMEGKPSLADKLAAQEAESSKAKRKAVKREEHEKHAHKDVDQSAHAEQINARVDAELEQRNDANAEGHAKNMEQIEREAAAAEEAKPHVPTGKSRDAIRNTPIIDPATGEKSWRS